MLPCRRASLLAAVALAALAPAVAHAEDVASYPVAGEADAGVGDAASRGAAVDDAFGRATAAALAELVSADVRAAKKDLLDQEILGHARRWVPTYKVTSDTTDGGRRQLAVTVKVDRDKLRARLAELGLHVEAAPPPADAPTRARTVTVLLRVARGEGDAKATYGVGADKEVPGSLAVAAALRAGGFTLRGAPSSGPAAHPDGDLPLEDDDAIALAGDVRADVAAVVGVRLSPATVIRGVAERAQVATAHVRLLDRARHATLGDGQAVAAGLGDDRQVGLAAAERAAGLATAAALPPRPHALAVPTGSADDDGPLHAEDGVVLVRLPARTSWGMLVAEQKHLAAGHGVTGATLRRISARGWVLAVATDQGVAKIAALARKAPATDTQATVKLTGDVIEVALTGSP
jgi:hypothetical protein